MFRRLATSSLAMIAMAVPALAEVTPAEVWDQFIAENEGFGMTVTEGNREEAGDTLTVTDTVFSTDSENSSMSMTIPKVVLNQTGDGGVRWSFDGDIEGTVSQTTPDDISMSTPFSISAPGNETVTRGSLDDLTHDYSAETATITMTFAVEDDDETSVPMVITLQNLSGTQRSVAASADAGREITFEMAADKMLFTLEGDFPAEQTGDPDSLSGNYAIDQLTLSGSGKMAAGTYDLETQMDQALQDGMSIALSMGYAGGSGEFSFSGTDEMGQESSGEGRVSTGPGEVSFSLSAEGLAYAGRAENSDNSLSSNSMPFPIRYAIESGSFDLRMPVMASETPAPFKLVAAIGGLTINDEVWSLFDPSAQLPRDPADLNIDVSGEAMLTESLFTPPSDAGPDEMPSPFEPLKVTINDVSLRAVGAEAAIMGELTAPESGSLTEAPVGKISGDFTGIEALMTTLGAMGLIPQEQMMGARMMLSMFARPVEGEPEKLTTELEFREDGSIFANGQQVK